MRYRPNSKLIATKDNPPNMGQTRPLITQQIAHIREAIADFCVRVIREPLTYFSEADCQQLLVEELKRLDFLKDLYPTSVLRGQASKSRYHTSLIHREYGGGGATRIDIVILPPDEVERIDNPNLTIGKRYLVPLYAFELGTEKTYNTAAHLRNDLNKLEHKVKEAAYIIHFFRDTTLAATGTFRRGKTEYKIERIFKNAFVVRRPAGAGKVRILPIIVRTGRNQTRMRGKCEIFDGSRWFKVNISRPDRIRQIILDQLK